MTAKAVVKPVVSNVTPLKPKVQTNGAKKETPAKPTPKAASQGKAKVVEVKPVSKPSVAKVETKKPEPKKEKEKKPKLDPKIYAIQRLEDDLLNSSIEKYKSKLLNAKANGKNADVKKYEEKVKVRLEELERRKKLK